MIGRRGICLCVKSVLLIVVLMVSSGSRIHRLHAAEDVKEAIIEAKSKVFPALVNIRVVIKTYYGGKQVHREAVGSGVIVTPQGHVVTNHHVVGKAKRFFCTLSNKEEIPAELVGTDVWTDIAVIKLHLDELKDRSAPIPTAKLADSTKVKVGDTVLAMGSPLALSRSVTMGIVSNNERVFPGEGTIELGRGETTGLFTRWIQHDASINPGNSGGPLVNLQGEIIGINELRSGANVGFAIPSNIVKEVFEKILKEGRVNRSWIGLGCQPLLKKSKYKRGVLIGSVVRDSPADKASIKPGDILLRLDGSDVTVRFPEELPPFCKRMSNIQAGKDVEAVVLRDDKELRLRVHTAEMKKMVGDEREFKAWGLTLQELTAPMARNRRLADKDGLLVTGVRGGGPAGEAKPPVARSDIIRVVDGARITSLSQFRELYEAAVKEKKDEILVELERYGALLLTVVKPLIEEEDEDRGIEIKKAWAACETQVLTSSLAKALGLGGKRGVRVTRIFEGLAAAEAGLQVGDVITELDGVGVPAWRERDTQIFQTIIRRKRIGHNTDFTVIRDGKVMHVQVTLIAAPISEREVERFKDPKFEISVRDITFWDRVRNKWEKGQAGVIVEQAEEGGWAALGRFRRGDLIQKVGKSEVDNVKSFEGALEQVCESKPNRVVFFVLRGIDTRYLVVEPKWDEIK